MAWGSQMESEVWENNISSNGLVPKLLIITCWHIIREICGIHMWAISWEMLKKTITKMYPINQAKHIVTVVFHLLCLSYNIVIECREGLHSYKGQQMRCWGNMETCNASGMTDWEIRFINSLAPGIFQRNLMKVIFQLILGSSISCKLVLNGPYLW